MCPRAFVIALVLTALVAPSTLAAGSGGAGLPSAGGGTEVGQAAPEPVPVRPAAPVLMTFGLSGTRLRFRIDSRDRRIRVRVVLRRPRSRRTVAAISLGARRTGRLHALKLNTARLASGRYVLGLSARDGRGRRLRRARGVRANRVLKVKRRARPAPTPAPAPSGHRFPIAGPFAYGGSGSRFGAPRSGHSHQGQDLSAPSGTPVVAPWRGAVKAVAYQASGAGHYVVLSGEGENRDYVFMHLLTGSIRVRKGDRVSTGQRLGSVGSTGASSGPHLHFEVWVGGWYGGGKPIDPLPLLKSWD
ncbi:MAG TPA: M23 family metallopeptidase [Acetobacteraceae bacterium]|nr:M23 family metallopeptidase [Acetobacteraceae bacterium]